MTVRGKPKASRLEILGAWLGLWTPPRDVVVPPVPWRKVGAGVAALAVLGVVAALTIAPAVDDAKREGAAERERVAERERAQRRARIAAEQRAREGSLPRAASRTAAVARVEAAIGLDARTRFDAGGAPAQCEPAPGQDTGARRVVFDCLATVREIVAGGEQEGAQGALAIPYRAALDFTARRYAFCKTNPRPGEAALPDAESIVELPRVCRM
jgi:hypothetical protein